MHVAREEGHLCKYNECFYSYLRASRHHCAYLIHTDLFLKVDYQFRSPNYASRLAVKADQLILAMQESCSLPITRKAPNSRILAVKSSTKLNSRSFPTAICLPLSVSFSTPYDPFRQRKAGQSEKSRWCFLYCFIAVPFCFSPISSPLAR